MYHSVLSNVITPICTLYIWHTDKASRTVNWCRLFFHSDTVTPSEAKHLHTQKRIHKRCVCREPLVICPVGLSLSCQDKACSLLAAMPSAHWRSAFLFKQTRGSVIYFLHRSWHEHTEVYSHDPSKCAGITHTGHRRNISLSLSRSLSLSLSLAQCRKKSNQVQGSPRSLCSQCFTLCGAPLVTSIILTHKAKLLEQTCIMRCRKTQGM